VRVHLEYLPAFCLSSLSSPATVFSSLTKVDHRSCLGALRFRRAQRAPCFQEPQFEGDEVVLLANERVGDDYLSHLQDTGVSYLFCGRDNVDVKAQRSAA
jgi:hypothetical protein